MKKIITVGHLKDCWYLKEQAEKIIVESTKDVDENFCFNLLRDLNGVEEIQINDSGNVYSSGNMIFCHSERGLILSFFFGTEKNVIVPEGVNIIGRNAFCDTEIESVELPESVFEISDAAFMDCKSLMKVELPDGLRKLGDSVFHDCFSLESIRIPESVTEIPNSAFFQCLKLKSIDIPASVWKIGIIAFFNCSSLAHVNFHEGLEIIEENAFRHCRIKEIFLPASVHTVLTGSLEGIECIHVKGYIPDLINAAAHHELVHGERSFCIDCGTEKIVLPDGMTQPSIKRANAVYEDVMKHQSTETKIHALYYLGLRTRSKHLAALNAYKLSKDKGVKIYLRRNGIKMLKCIQSEEEMLEFLDDFREIGLTKSMYEFGLALSREKNWTCATAQILEMSCKSHSSFSL